MMQSKLTVLSIVVMGVALQACSTAKMRVMPMENGELVIKSVDYESAGAAKAATKAAKQYCEQQGKTAVFMNENTTYQGAIDEKANKTLKRVGDAVWHVNAKNGNYGHLGRVFSSNEDYETTIKFRCE